MEKNKVTASQIIRALSEYCQKDFFITECKNGSTWFPPKQGLMRFDGLSIKKSWTDPKITIFEVKVSRSDFKADPKFHLYRQYCNEFYFVTPKGMIDKNEVPDWAGMIEFNPENGKLLKKKKSLWQEIELNPDLLMYLIMNAIDSDRLPFYSNRKEEYARDYLQNKADKKQIGYALGTKMAKDLQEADKTIYRLENCKMEMEDYKEAKKFMDKIENTPWGGYGKLSDRIKDEFGKGYPPELDAIQKGLQAQIETIQRIKKGATENEKSEL